MLNSGVAEVELPGHAGELNFSNLEIAAVVWLLWCYDGCILRMHCARVHVHVLSFADACCVEVRC